MVSDGRGGVMRIGPPQTKSDNDQVRWSVHVDADGLPDELWFSVTGLGGTGLSDRIDAAVIALLLPAMRAGFDIEADGLLTDVLADQLRRDYQPLVRLLMPFLSQVELRIRSVPPQDRGQGVLTGFSAGIDSFAVLDDYYFAPDLPPSMRVSHLVLNNVGSHHSRASFEGRVVVNRLHAEELGLPLVVVDSNLADFYPGWDFQQTHSPRNAAVAHLLAPVVGTYLYASTFDYSRVHAVPTYDIAYVDPISLPLVSTPALTARSTGSAYTRVEKTLKVAQIPLARRALDVCAEDTVGNCSVCWKCKRTLMTLEVDSLLDAFDQVFDLRAWALVRDDYVRELHRARFTDPQARDILALARARAYPFDQHPVLAGTVAGGGRVAYRQARKMAGRALRATRLRS